MNKIRALLLKWYEPVAEANFAKADSVVRSDETFFSPVIRIDAETQSAILMYRDTETGEVEKSFPSDSKLEKAYEEQPSSSNKLF